MHKSEKKIHTDHSSVTIKVQNLTELLIIILIHITLKIGLDAVQNTGQLQRHELIFM